MPLHFLICECGSKISTPNYLERHKKTTLHKKRMAQQLPDDKYRQSDIAKFFKPKIEITIKIENTTIENNN